MDCNKCGEKLDTKNSKPNFWKKGDEGLDRRHPWNKEGEVKDYSIICPKCGEDNHWLPM